MEGSGYTCSRLLRLRATMKSMGHQRRLGLCFLGVSFLPVIYIICLNLEITWRMDNLNLAQFPGIWYTQEPNRLRYPEDPLVGNTLSDGSDDQHTRITPPTPLSLKVQSTSPARIRASTQPGARTTKGSDLKGALLKSAKPTEPPFIGDSYYSEDAPPQTDCPDSIRSRVSQTDFGVRYLGRIPVLQWAKHATPEQYQRLRLYPGTHGWGNLDFNTLVSTLSVLNTSANWHMFDDWDRRSNGSRCVRCAVVGNGGILKDSKKGRDIDQHDYIFRTNGAVIKGFEQDVGSRTSLYTFSTNTLRNSMRSYAGAGYRGPPLSEETRYVFLPDHDRDYLLMKAAATHTPVERGPEKSKTPPTYFGGNVTVEKLKMYHPDFIRYIRNRFLRAHAMQTKYKDIYRPSTGAVMLLAAVHTCDQVSAYGFMTPDYVKYSDHYFDRQYHPVGFFINHDMKMELRLWQQLHHAGLITLYMRQ
ncbi:alpha-N-acetylgalactosaminide alpha-2,6-sialyltransferase 2 isoform X2 [Salmo salar]|uniref:alpha-N-acetylgalactosaminide alpha-2,6-sialyltransferase n=1 Tax=Salmo salar TaxID=8030 RepID=A0A1S3Q737_SALSA|nr:alpha-N-acetylgalactosaminide alpha-2,6-sialyltransferase 2-like isoform X2 [Salmo salar]|eukprot:XP_014035790.1 PREDICTED: alpha-N-acetylgalactosaminide alpha-2,6-sialyltransferase 2-like [Salmo salar]